MLLSVLSSHMLIIPLCYFLFDLNVEYYYYCYKERPSVFTMPIMYVVIVSLSFLHRMLLSVAGNKFGFVTFILRNIVYSACDRSAQYFVFKH